jgi:hypothetical protein
VQNFRAIDAQVDDKAVEFGYGLQHNRGAENKPSGLPPQKKGIAV